MPKFLLLFFLSYSLLYAGKIEVFATNIDSNDSSLHAHGDVVVLFGDSYLSANEVIYNHEEETVELFGHIMALKGENYFGLGEHAKYDIKKDMRMFEPFYMLDKKSEVWMSTTQSVAQDNKITLTSGMVSGCNPNEPLWKIYYSEADYDGDTKWVDLYNARLHFYNIPVFYFPYFGYSLDTKRRSGLLTPSWGYSESEGMYYEQPLYITTDDWWDLELKPQVRTKRGKGIYGTFRFVDSKVSSGEITSGYFKEKASYIENDGKDLAHNEHYGFNLKYENYDVLNQWIGTSLEGQSGLYSDILWMNDVDYINLQNNDDVKNTTSRQLLSRINLFYNTEKDYFGTYFNYYLDLEKESNNLVIQKLPTLQYHHYMQTFLDNHLFYNIDVTTNNLTRPEGKKALINDVEIPIEIQTSVFDNFLDLSYTSKLKGEYINFSGVPVNDFNGSDNLDSGVYGRYFHIFEAGTYLSKGYQNFTHNTGFSINYTKKGGDYTSGYYEDVDSICSVTGGTNNPLCEFYQIDEVKDGINLEMSQFVVDSSGKQVIYHRLSQNISYESSDERLGELESEFEYYITKGLYYYNNTFYNHSRQRITKLLNTLRYNNKQFTLSINHYYDDLLKDDVINYSSYLTTNVRYRYDSHYSYMAGYAYDFENATKKRVEVGFLYEKRCWNFGLRYVENNRPILTSTDASSIYDRYVYFTIALQPMGGSEFNYKLSNVLEGS